MDNFGRQVSSNGAVELNVTHKLYIHIVSVISWYFLIPLLSIGQSSSHLESDDVVYLIWFDWCRYQSIWITEFSTSNENAENSSIQSIWLQIISTYFR